MSNPVFIGQSELLERAPYGNASKPLAVPLSDVRLHIDIEHKADDPLITQIIYQATEEAENRGNVALLTQRRRLVLSFDDLQVIEGTKDTVVLPFGPVASVTQVQYLDANEATQTWAASNYRFISRGTRRGVWFKNLPTVADGAGVLWIEYETGYGPSGASVPKAWQAVIWAIAARRYDYRHVMGGGMDDAYERMMRRLVDVAGGDYSYA